MKNPLRRSRKKSEAAETPAVTFDPAIENATSMSDAVGLIDHDSQASSWGVTQMAGAGDISPEAQLTTLDGVENAEEIDAALAQIEVQEAQAEVHDTPAPAAEPQSSETLEFDRVTSSYTEAEVVAMAHKAVAAIDTRCAFEKDKKGEDANIQRTLKKCRAVMTSKRAARVMLACNVDPEVMNRTVHEGARYNVYAIGKLGDAVFGLSGGVIANAINLAIMRSLFRFRAAGLTFTGEMAKAACSAQIRVADTALRNALVRHTVAPSTAPTQSSSTMQALETLGIVKREGSSRNPTYTLTETPQVAKLEKVLAAAA